MRIEVPVSSTTVRQTEERLDDQGGQTQAQPVDEKQTRLTSEATSDGEHLLLTAPEQARLAPPQRSELGKQLERACDRPPPPVTADPGGSRAP
jgi:hypothetical protein